MNPSIGRIVHYHSQQDGPCQAAAVVKVWSPETVNLVVFRDGSNDQSIDNVQTPTSGIPPTTYWATSAVLEEEPRTKSHAWHWPERED